MVKKRQKRGQKWSKKAFLGPSGYALKMGPKTPLFGGKKGSKMVKNGVFSVFLLSGPGGGAAAAGPRKRGSQKKGSRQGGGGGPGFPNPWKKKKKINRIRVKPPTLRTCFSLFF